jgi:hypothetical protein
VIAMNKNRTNIARLYSKSSLTRFDAFRAVATSPARRAGFTLAANTQAAIPNGQKQKIEMIASGQRDDTEAVWGPAAPGDCHVGLGPLATLWIGFSSLEELTGSSPACWPPGSCCPIMAASMCPLGHKRDADRQAEDTYPLNSG